MRKLTAQFTYLFGALLLTSCASDSSKPYSSTSYSYPETVTIHEEVIYDSPYTEIRKVKDSSGRTIRYEKRVK